MTAAKKLYLCDLEGEEIKERLATSQAPPYPIYPSKKIHPCVGCFGCWVKTPAACLMKDSFETIGSLYAACDEVAIISRCCYGGFSPFIKNVLDRSIPYILPYFTLRNGEMHHKSRYEKQLRLSVYFYGDNITPEEKEIARQLVAANGLNFNTIETSVHFFTGKAALIGGIQ